MEDIENIISELAAPVKTFRIFAIEKAMKANPSEKLLEALKQAQKQENDPECLMLIDHAIASSQERLLQCHSEKPADKARVTLAEFARLKADQQLLMVKKTSSANFKTQSAAEGIKKLVQSSAHDVVRAEIVKKCWQFWPADFVSFLEQNLFSDSSALQLACLEAIISIAPDKLQQNFDKLVISRDPLIRAISIRGLAKKYPKSAAGFLAESIRKGDYFSRLAALRAISVMPFTMNKASLLDLLAHEHDQRLLKIAAAIVLANPDRETPFRLCDIIEKATSTRADFLRDLQKNCCSMVRMAEICPDFNLYMQTLKRYPNRIKATLFVENCISTYDSTTDVSTRRELIKLLREKCQTPEVLEASNNYLKQSARHELITQALVPEAPVDKKKAGEATTNTQKTDTSGKTETEDLLSRLVRIRTRESKNARATIEEAFRAVKPGTAIMASALRAAIFADDSRWNDKARQMLRNDNEDLIAAALEYLANFDNENFLLQIRLFIKNPSLIVRTALLRSLCRQNPDNARDLLKSMLKDKDAKVREKALGSLIHFEFSSVRELLVDFLEKEKEIELVKASLPFYLTNPILESTYDLRYLARKQPAFATFFNETSELLNETLVELSLTEKSEIQSYIAKRESAEQTKAAEDERVEAHRLAGVAEKIKWNNISESISELSQYYGLLKKIFLGGMLLFALFFFLAGSSEQETEVVSAGYNPVASEIQDYQLLVQKIDMGDGAILATDANRDKIMVLPRPGKMFRVRPGDKLLIRAMPFRKSPDGTLVVKTIEVKNSL